MCMLYQKEIQRVLFLLGKLLGAHIENHNNLFNRGLFSIFKKIPYDKYVLVCKEIEEEIILFINELKNMVATGSEKDCNYAKKIITYLGLFKESVISLSEINESLHYKGEGGRFSRAEYEQLLNRYKENELKRTNQGSVLNKVKSEVFEQNIKKHNL